MLASWTRLTSLSLADTAVSNPAILTLKPAANLLALNLDGTALDDDTLRRMAGWRKLHTLSIERTKVTGAGLGELAALPDLERLYLAPSQFSEQAVASLQQKRPKMSRKAMERSAARWWNSPISIRRWPNSAA